MQVRGEKLDRVDTVPMNAQSPAEGRHQPCVRGAESYERERRTGRNNHWYQKGGWTGRIEKSSGCAAVLSPGRMDSRCWSLEQEADPAIAEQVHVYLQNLPRTVYGFTGRWAVNLRSLLGGLALRFFLQPEAIERSEKLQLFLGSLHYY